MIKQICLQLMALLFLSLPSFSRGKQDSSARHHFAIGLSLPGIKVIDAIGASIPTNKFLVNYDPIRYLKIEVQGNFSKGQSDVQFTPVSGGPSYPFKPKQKAIFIDGGLMGICPLEKTRVLGGIRYGVNSSSYDNIGVDTSGVPFIAKGTILTANLSGVIAAEYLFSKSFSIGAEFSLLSSKTVRNSGYPGQEDQISKGIFSEGCLVIRCYPF